MMFSKFTMRDETLGYLRTLLGLEESMLKNLNHREERWPTLKEAIAYRTGRVEMFRELIEFIEKQ